MSKTQHQDTPATQVRELKESVRLLDCYAQEGLGSIESIAELALLAMETPKGQRDMERFAQAFDTIRRLAGETRELIGCEAEQKECGYQNNAGDRRRAACMEEHHARSAA